MEQPTNNSEAVDWLEKDIINTLLAWLKFNSYTFMCNASENERARILNIHIELTQDKNEHKT